MDMSSGEAKKSIKHQESTFPFLQKFFPSIKFVNSIPLKAQKGFKDIAINFTCLDVCEQYFAIGTNIGIVYLYDRKKEHLYKLRNKEYTNPITCVKLLVSLECMVAVGTKNGHVFAFKVPFKETEEIEKFKVDGLHIATITSLEWAKNGLKFFSGDLNGTVVCTEIDYFEHESRSCVLLEEKSTIVQLSYANLILLVSTYQRSFLYDTHKDSSLQIGQKERKCSGDFGATIYGSGTDSPCIYASRPGQRIWKSDFEGIISETIILKAEFLKSTRMSRAAEENAGSKDFQFGPLKVYDGNFLLTWSSEKVVLIDPKKKAIKCVLDMRGIIDVATNHQEVIVLQGLRHVMRFAINPEEEEQYISKGVECADDTIDTVPLQPEKTELEQNHADELDAPKVLDWIKRKLSEVTIPAQEKAVGLLKNERSNTVAGVISVPDIVEFDTNCPQVEVNGEVQFTEQASNRNATPDSFYALDDEIVYKPKKKKKKKKKKVLQKEENDEALQHPTMSQEEVTSVNDEGRTKSPTDTAHKLVENSEQSSETIVTKPMENNMPEGTIDCAEDAVDCAKGTVDCANDSSTSETPKNSLLSHDNKEESINESSELTISTAPKCISENENSDDDPFDTDDIYSNRRYTDETQVGNAKPESSLEKEYPSKPRCDSSVLSINREYPKYGIECVQYTAPGPIISLSASSYHLFCIDNQYNVYISGFSDFGFKWVKLPQPGEQIAVSPSEHIIWILYQQSVYAAKKPNSLDWWKSKSVEWIPVARSISYIAVDDTCSWYISTSGHLFTNPNLSSARPYGYPIRVMCPSDAVKVACKDDNVWLLTSDDKLYCRIIVGDDDNDNIKGTEWELVTLPPMLPLSMVSFGSKKEAYMLSSNDSLWFRLGVTSLTPHGINTTMEVESSHYVYESQGQIRKVVTKVINNELLSNIFYKHKPGIIASSSAGVWWCKASDTVLYSYEKCIIGHSWDPIIPKGTSASTEWVMVSAEGYCSSQGILWGADSTGELICFSLKSIHSIGVNLPVSVSLKHVHFTSHGMWILTTDGDIYIRREMSDRCPQGVWWQQLDTSQINGVTFCHISCSSESVWACDTNGNIHVRFGTLTPPAGDGLSQVWIQVDTLNNSSPFLAQKVYVGPKSYMVWTIDSQGCVYSRSKISLKYLLGDQWIFVPSPKAKQLCISGNAVWLIKNSGKIFRRFGITKSNPTGDYWKQIPGNLSYISVTEEDDLWGIQDGSLLCHNSYTLKYDSRFESTVNLAHVSDDDWEDISAQVSD